VQRYRTSRLALFEERMRERESRRTWAGLLPSDIGRFDCIAEKVDRRGLQRRGPHAAKFAVVP
jgi:hypothetical protein